MGDGGQLAKIIEKVAMDQTVREIMKQRCRPTEGRAAVLSEQLARVKEERQWFNKLHLMTVRQQVANVLWSMSVMSIPRGGAMHHDRPTVYDLLITASEALTPPITAAAPTASATASAWRGAERFTKRGRRLWRR